MSTMKYILYTPGYMHKQMDLKRLFLMVFYGTATQYRLYSAGECVVNVRVSVCAEYSGVVPPAPSSSG